MGKRDDGGDAGIGEGSRFCKRAKVTRAVTNVQKTFLARTKSFLRFRGWNLVACYQRCAVSHVSTRGLRGCNEKSVRIRRLNFPNDISRRRLK